MKLVSFLSDMSYYSRWNPLAEVDDLVRTWSWGLGITKRDTFPMTMIWVHFGLHSARFPLADFRGSGVSLILHGVKVDVADSRWMSGATMRIKRMNFRVGVQEKETKSIYKNLEMISVWLRSRMSQFESIVSSGDSTLVLELLYNDDHIYYLAVYFAAAGASPQLQMLWDREVFPGSILCLAICLRQKVGWTRTQFSQDSQYRYPSGQHQLCLETGLRSILVVCLQRLHCHGIV